MVRRLSAALALLAVTVLAACGGDGDTGRASAVQETQKANASAPAQRQLDTREPAQPKGPSQIELAIVYRAKLYKLDKKFDREERRLSARFKHATTPASYIRACRIFKGELNKLAHRLSVLMPPRRVREYHRRDI